MIYGYARVSSKTQAINGNSLEAQSKLLQENGATIIYHDVYTGTTTDRPELDKLIQTIQSGDTLIVTKLDRIARSLIQGVELINNLSNKGVKIIVLNMGVIDNSSTGKLIRNIMLSFAEFERELILERMRDGREIARTREGYKEGRPHKFSAEQINLAYQLMQSNTIKQTSKLTGISTATLSRIKRDKKSLSS